MSLEPRLYAQPTARIICHETKKLVGFLYKWNNGEIQEAWIHGKVRKVDHIQIDDAAINHVSELK